MPDAAPSDEEQQVLAVEDAVVDPAEDAGTMTTAARYALTHIRRRGQWRALAFHASRRDPVS
jgi:hypothetical protein